MGRMEVCSFSSIVDQLSLKLNSIDELNHLFAIYAIVGDICNQINPKCSLLEFLKESFLDLHIRSKIEKIIL